MHVSVFRKNDERTIYNAIYRDGKFGFVYMKRFAVKGITRDKEYDLTQGTEGSRVLYFSANPNGEAETIKIYLKPKPKLKKLIFELDFSQLAIKGRQSMGNILTRYQVHRIVLKEAGVSTLGGLKIWFDEVVFRLNTEERGLYLGEFKGDDRILVVTKDGYYSFTNFDLANHYPDNILLIEQYDPGKIFTAVFWDAEQGFYYLKRFEFEDTRGESCFISEGEGSKLVLLSGERWPQFRIIHGGKHAGRPDEDIDADAFIAVKGVKAKGKRLTNFEVKQIIEIEPLVKEEPEEELTDEDLSIDDQAEGEEDGPIKVVPPEKPGEQMSLF